MNKRVWRSIFTYKNGKLFWKYDRSQKTRAGDPAGSPNGNGRMLVGLNGKSYCINRIIYEMHNDEIPKGMIIEYINGNPLDNRVENLRLVNKIRSKERRLQKNNKSGVSGVHFAALINRWEAWFGEKLLGRFEDFETAVNARREAEINHRGDY